MGMSVLRLSVPKDPVAAVRYLDSVAAEVEATLSEHYADAYFTARFDGRFEEALAAGQTSRKRALRLVRWVNNRTGRAVRWNDGLDPQHSTYSPVE